MRVFSRFALVVLVVLLAVPSAVADHLIADCPMSLVSTDPAVADFALSPHGVFRFGSQVFVLRGQRLTTFNITEVGDMQVARVDTIRDLVAHETNAGVAFSNGFLYVSSGAGLEVFDLRNTRTGGTPPAFVARTPGLHFRRLAVSGNTLVGLFPATDLPCSPREFTPCFNTIEIFNIANPSAPVRTATISSTALSPFALGYNDIAIVGGQLVATSLNGTYAFNISNPAAPFHTFSAARNGSFLVTSASGNTVAIGEDRSVTIYGFNAATGFNAVFHYTLPQYLTIDRANPIVFHPEAWLDEANSRLITLVDELDPHTLRPARTIAFAVYDWGTFQHEGSAPRTYEAVTRVVPDEVKHTPLAVGNFIYTVGEMSGLQTWGACGVATGRIEFDGIQSLTCGGAKIHGWVTGTQRISSVELFLDAGSLGSATPTGPPRIDISSRTPVFNWSIDVNLDQIARGDHVLRAVSTDASGRRQFASLRVFFPGPPNNCVPTRRQAASRF